MLLDNSHNIKKKIMLWKLGIKFKINVWHGYGISV